jgi:hypothetical protein
MITVDEFKGKLRDKSISDLEIVQRYITHGPPFVFGGDEDKYFKLKQTVAQKFGLNPQYVIMIGSGKLGFSISPLKRWQPFRDESDIDMVIISSDIFDRFWKELYDFNIKLTDRTMEEEKQYYSFLEYFFKGWLRPDVFPFSYVGRKEWIDFFKSISYGEFGDHKISGAVFRDWGFYEAYHTNNIREIRNGGVV